MPVIPAIREAIGGRITVQDQPSGTKHMTPCPKIITAKRARS
jgi:hypothetical protein